MTKQGGWPSTGFGSRLRELRTEAGVSQKELAERAGCNVFTVAKLERGVQEPAWPLVLALAHALGVNCLAFTDKNILQEAQRKKGQSRPSKSETASAGRKRRRGQVPRESSP